MRFLERGLDAYRKLRSKRGYTCDDCGREIFSYPTERLCEGCLSLLEKNDKSVCPKCGRKTLAEGVCLDCKRRVPPFARGMSAFVYGGEAARLINRLKNGERFLSRFFGERMAPTRSYPCRLRPKRKGNGDTTSPPSLRRFCRRKRV